MGRIQGSQPCDVGSNPAVVTSAQRAPRNFFAPDIEVNYYFDAARGEALVLTCSYMSV